MSTLYRDYRPNNFFEVLGQNHIKLTLQNEILAKHLGHAYLFCGPRAVGKTTTARILAKAINCLNRKDDSFEPCNECDNCLSIKKGNNLDVLEIDAASNTGVDNVRENIISFSRIAPSNGRYKVFIIDEVHMLSLQAFNALLKIMEEPPTYVVFILCTTEIQKVPGTIISRCERFDFKKISLVETLTKLSQITQTEGVKIDREVLEAIAKKSGGYMRDAESLLGQILSIGGKVIKKEQADLILPPASDREALSLIKNLSKKDTAKAFILLNSLSDSGINMKNFNAELIAISRRLLLDKISPGLSDSLGLDLGETIEKDLLQVSALLNEEEIIFLIKKFMIASSDNRSQNIPQLPLEIAIAEICLGLKDGVDSDGAGDNKPKQVVNKLITTNLKSDNFSQSNVLKKDLVQEQKPETKALNIVLENLSQAEVYAKWPEFLVKIKNHNHSLSFVMQSCHPQAIIDSCLSLAFKYKFHQNRVNENDIRTIVKNVLAEVYGTGLDFKTEIDENLKIGSGSEIGAEIDSSETPIIPQTEKTEEKKQPEDALGNLLNAFGGEVIN